MKEILDYQKLIEEGFDIIDKRGNRVPFILNVPQRMYMAQLKKDYPTMEPIRDNILKARKEGFSSLIDAIIAVDFLIKDNIGAQIISHKDNETKVLFERVRFFIDSWCERAGVDKKALLDTDSANTIKNRDNGSFIYLGTAGAKTLGRGPTLQNIHWSEVGFYPSTEIMNAEKLVVGAEQQVATDVGKIFRESTGNMWGDFYFKECERSRKEESTFKFRFFSWFDDPQNKKEVEVFDPTPEEREWMEIYKLDKTQMYWYREKLRESESKALTMREYPFTPEEAFLAAGKGFFDPDVLKDYRDKVKPPIKEGNMAMDGNWV